MDNEEPLKKIINEARRQNIGAIKHYDALLQRYENVNQVNERFFENIKNTIKEKANKDKTKYKTYLQINPSLNSPHVCNDLSQIEVLSKLRTSAHILTMYM